MSLSKFLDFFAEPFFEQAQQVETTTVSPPEPEVEVFHVSYQPRKARLQSEIMMIAPYYTKFEGVDYDPENCDWLVIPKYPLPEKWQNRWCKLLIIFPETYPISPPTGFYLNRKFQLKGGGADPHLTGSAYHGAADLTANNWFWYCVTVESGLGGWKPSPDYRNRDNLWTYLSLIREALTSYA